MRERETKREIYSYIGVYRCRVVCIYLLFVAILQGDTVNKHYSYVKKIKKLKKKVNNTQARAIE